MGPRNQQKISQEVQGKIDAVDSKAQSALDQLAAEVNYLIMSNERSLKNQLDIERLDERLRDLEKSG